MSYSHLVAYIRIICTTKKPTLKCETASYCLLFPNANRMQHKKKSSSYITIIARFKFWINIYQHLETCGKRRSSADAGPIAHCAIIFCPLSRACRAWYPARAWLQPQRWRMLAC